MVKHWAGQYKVAIEFIQQLCGIQLDDSKEYLINSRFEKLCQKFQANSLIELIELAKSDHGEPVRRAIVEAITIRETQFFRDPAVFDAFRNVSIPEILKYKRAIGSHKIRIWSAASSSGQESCSIAITLLEAIPDIRLWDVEILGTDISRDAIAKAKRGIYSKLEVERGMPASHLQKYMRPHADGYKINESVAKLLTFREMNLLQTFPFKDPFDAVFCRNVAIYFEKAAKLRLFRRLLPLLLPQGFLFVGASESLVDCGVEFKPHHYLHRATYYQPNEASAFKSPLQHSEVYPNVPAGRSDRAVAPRENAGNRINLNSEINSGMVRYDPTSNFPKKRR